MRGVWLVRDDMTLVPDEKTKRASVKCLMPGITVEARIDLDRPRSLPQHRRYFAKLKETTSSLHESFLRLFYGNLLDDLVQTQEIDYELLHEIFKRVYGVSSIAFRNMDQEEAGRFFKAADEWLERLTARLQS